MSNSPFKPSIFGFRHKTELVVAIDFGTTYTGVAWAYSDRTNILVDTGFSPDQLRDKITVLKSWPGIAGSYTDKVPSTLAYNSSGQVVAWGGRVKSSHLITVSHFKLGLQEGINEHYLFGEKPNSDRSSLEKMLSVEAWKHDMLGDKDAYDHVRNFFEEIHEYLVAEALPRDFGKKFLDSVSIRYVLTVPAIWSDKAKDLTRKAACHIGIPDRDLTMISEPEAAALYCSTLCHEVDLEDGDYFMVCDAGGGTVVSLYFGSWVDSIGFDLIRNDFSTSV
jgi:molecular chaperone DnaK (HSP70)